MIEQQKHIPWRLRELNARLARRTLRREALRRLALRAGGALALTALGLVLVLALAQDTAGSLTSRTRRPRGSTVLASTAASPPEVSNGTATVTIGQLQAGGTTLTLAPPATGAAATKQPSALRVTATDRAGAPLPGITIWLTITGLVPYDGVATTNQSGVAAFSYLGNGKPYTVHITATVDGSQVATSTVQVGQPPSVTTTAVTARFYASDGRCTYDTPTGKLPLFVQDFPTINFEGRPFTDYGVRAGQPNLVAADGTTRIGMGRLNHFDAVFTGDLLVRQAGDVPFTFLIDDAFNLGVGDGATRVGGTMSNPPASGMTALEHLPMVGAFNQGHLEALTSTTVHFPHAGAFPFEIDYAECMGGDAAIRISSGGQFLGESGR